MTAFERTCCGCAKSTGEPICSRRSPACRCGRSHHIRRYDFAQFQFSARFINGDAMWIKRDGSVHFNSVQWSVWFTANSAQTFSSVFCCRARDRTLVSAHTFPRNRACVWCCVCLLVIGRRFGEKRWLAGDRTIVGRSDLPRQCKTHWGYHRFREKPSRRAVSSEPLHKTVLLCCYCLDSVLSFGSPTRRVSTFRHSAVSPSRRFFVLVSA